MGSSADDPSSLDDIAGMAPLSVAIIFTQFLHVLIHGTAGFPPDSLLPLCRQLGQVLVDLPLEIPDDLRLVRGAQLVLQRRAG